jgi:hypothetical protein
MRYLIGIAILIVGILGCSTTPPASLVQERELMVWDEMW